MNLTVIGLIVLGGLGFPLSVKWYKSTSGGR